MRRRPRRRCAVIATVVTSALTLGVLAVAATVWFRRAMTCSLRHSLRTEQGLAVLILQMAVRLEKGAHPALAHFARVVRQELADKRKLSVGTSRGVPRQDATAMAGRGDLLIKGGVLAFCAAV